jgi:hypothetical protein
MKWFYIISVSRGGQKIIDRALSDIEIDGYVIDCERFECNKLGGWCIRLAEKFFVRNDVTKDNVYHHYHDIK